MEEILAYQVWLALPLETREKLAKVFGISKTGRTVVDYRANGAVVTQDGYTPDDLRSITVKKLQEALKTRKTDFYDLVEKAVENIDAVKAGTYVYETNPNQLKKGDEIFIEQAWENEAGDYVDEIAEILSVGRDGRLKLKFKKEEVTTFLADAEFFAHQHTVYVAPPKA